MTSYSRQDVLRILQISTHQLLGWERAGLIPQQQTYTFQDLGHLKMFRALREECVPAASIRHSILAMKAVAGMANPLLEASLVRTGTRLAFRHGGSVVDPIRRQLLFDFERMDRRGRSEHPTAVSEPSPLRRPGMRGQHGIQDRFFSAVQAEEAGEKDARGSSLSGDSGDRSKLRGSVYQLRDDQFSSTANTRGQRNFTGAQPKSIPGYVLDVLRSWQRA